MKGIKVVYFDNDYQIWVCVFTDGTRVQSETKSGLYELIVKNL